MKPNWDDLRYVLAVAREGSVAAAARSLGVNHATVLRRVAQFEDTHDRTVFDKAANGYRVTQGAAKVIEALVEAEHAMEAVASLARDGRTPLRGDVRITSTDTLCAMILPRVVRRIHAQERDLRLELLSSNAYVDLERSVAEISVRPARTLPTDLNGTRCGALHFAVYRASDRTGVAGWLNLGGDLARSIPARWMADHVPEKQLLASADSFLTLRDLVREGMGQSFLPCFVGDRQAGLERVPGTPTCQVDLWVVSHVSLKDTARIARLRSLLVEYMADEAHVLQGTSA